MLTECYLQIVGTYLAGTVPVAAATTLAPTAVFAVEFVEDTQAQSMLPEVVPAAATLNRLWTPAAVITEGMNAIVAPLVNCVIPPLAPPLPL